MKSSSVQREGGAALLQELEALSQALYKAHGQDSSAELSARRRASEVVGRSRIQVKQDGRHSISAINPAGKVGQDDDSALPEWLEENLAFSQSLEAPLQKRSFWDWKPLRALAHIGQQRFGCEFSAHVHGIEKLSGSMSGLRLQVHLQHKDAGVHTMPARVSHGCVEFEETMQFQCTVYGSKKSNGSVKYMSKSFSLFVVAPDAPELDLGKHKLDLTRILPSTASSSQSEGNNIWNTSFKLSGKAKGAALWVTFSYEFMEGNHKGLKFAASPATRRLGAGSGIRSFSSLPSSPQVSYFSATRKKNASVDFDSPMSEPGEWSLDESPPKPEMKPAAVAMSSSSSFDSRGPPLFPHLESSAVPATPGRPQVLVQSKTPGRAEDEGPDFNVVEKGLDNGSTEQSEEIVDYKDVEGDESGEDEQELETVDQESVFEQQEKEVKVHELSEEEQDIDQGVTLSQPAEEQQEAVDLAEEEQGIIDFGEDEQEAAIIEQGYWVDDEQSEVKIVDQGQAAEEGQQLVTVLDSDYLNEAEEEDDRGAQEQVEQDIGEYDWKEADGPDGLHLPEEVVQEQKLEGVHQIAYESSDEVDMVAGEFLHMLEEGDPSSDEAASSPKAMLLKQFESEAGFELALDTEDEQPAAKSEDEPLKNAHPNQVEQIGIGWSSDDDKDLAAIVDAAESELQKAAQAMRSRARAKMLEDAEAEALLHEWGLNEKAFQASPPKTQAVMNSADSGRTSGLLVVRQELPPLALGLGPVVPTSDGGSLRAMNSSLFHAASNNGQLVMHVSKPVVVPTEMGSSAMEVLRTLASVGTESMTAQAMQAMPLEDITGKSVQQIALEGQACFEESRQRYDATLNALEYQAASSRDIVARNSSTGMVSADEMRFREKKQQASASSADFLSLDELAPVAMEKIEALALQGLKVQCNMAEEEAPYAIEPGTSSRPMLEAGTSDSSDGMIAMSLSLDEWMRLDAGLDNEEETNDKTLAVLAAHGAAHSTTTDLILNLGDQQSQKGPGNLGDTLTLAMLVQLRDPLRNYEPVGAPMMALVEAERVLVPPKPRLFKRVGLRGDTYKEDEDEAEETERKQLEPQFKITGVHMAGLSTGEDSKKKASSSFWGSVKQQQSGSRWLIASGMAKTGSSTLKHPLLKSKQATSGASVAAGSRSTLKQSSSDSLWSISSKRGGGWGSSRNPDVKFGAGFKKR